MRLRRSGFHSPAASLASWGALRFTTPVPVLEGFRGSSLSSSAAPSSLSCPVPGSEPQFFPSVLRLGGAAGPPCEDPGCLGRITALCVTPNFGARHLRMCEGTSSRTQTCRVTRAPGSRGPEGRWSSLHSCTEGICSLPVALPR